jgi:hypothetical protein
MRLLNNFLSLVLVSIVLWSCQKEIDGRVAEVTPPPVGPGVPAGVLVDRTVTLYGTDSITVRYFYDSQKRLIEKEVTSSDATVITLNDKLIRDGQGIIRQIIEKTSEYRLIGIDSVIWDVQYNPTTQRYTGRSTNPVSYHHFRDTTVFIYDASGKVTQVETSTYTAATGFTPYEKYTLAYDAAGNTAESKFYFVYTAPQYDWTFTYTYTYDMTKTNVLDFGIENILFEPWNGIQKNMLVRQKMEHSDAQYNMQADFTTTYNSSNHPVSAVLSLQPVAAPQTIKFYYR